MIRAAIELVKKKGPRGFTLNEASRSAGVSASAPYNHFKDKEALLIEVVVLGNRTLEAELQDAANRHGTVRDRLRAVYLAYIEFAKRHPELFAVMFQSGIDKTPYPEVHSSGARAFGVAVDLAVQLESSAAAAQELALAVWTMAHGFATLTAEGAIRNVTDGTSQPSANRLAERFLLQGS